MWDDEERENRVKQLESKLEEIQKHIEETEASIEDIEDAAEGEKANMFTVNQDTPPFQVHWIKPEETSSFEDCDAIDSVEKAQKAFKEAAEYRDESVKRVLHGDVLFLLCNKAPEPEPDPDDPENIPEKGVCYYIGMCVKVSTVQMKKDPSSDYDELTETILTDTGEPNREFFAWDSCGGAALTGGHTGDETHRRLDVDNVAVNYSAGCQDLRGEGDEKRVTVTIPIFERDFTFENGLLKEVSDETGAAQGLTIEFFLPCGGGGDGDFGCEQIEICDGAETKTIYVATHPEACP